MSLSGARKDGADERLGRKIIVQLLITKRNMDFDLVAILVPISLCVVLPVMIVWIVAKTRTHEVNKRTEVVLAAIEKNSDIDVDKFFQKMSPEKLSIKERLLSKMQKGIAMSIMGGCGLLMGIGMLIAGWNSDSTFIILVISGVLLAVGVGFIANYTVGKKMLEKEMQAELDNMAVAAQANPKGSAAAPKHEEAGKPAGEADSADLSSGSITSTAVAAESSEQE